MITTALTIALYLPLYSPSYHGLLSESPTAIIDEVESVESEVEAETLTVEATFYTAKCDGCSGITKTGDNVRKSIYVDGYRIIAVDPKAIPLRSIVRVTLANGTTFEAVASDTGGDIKGGRIDVLVASKREAYALGRMSATITIIRSGGETNE